MRRVFCLQEEVKHCNLTDCFVVPPRNDGDINCYWLSHCERNVV
jgi:hypothetical protein